MVRIAGEILTPLLTIAVSFVGKYLIDLLAGVWVVEDTAGTLIFLFACLLTISLLRAVSYKVLQYCQSMHHDLISGRLAVILMDRSVSMDLEYFDNPAYYDKLMAATRDSSAINTLLWNALSCISACVSFLGAFLVLCRSNVFYGLLMIAAAIPSSIAGARYTKSLYHLSIEQINGERKKNYYQSIAVDRSYAQDVRLLK